MPDGIDVFFYDVFAESELVSGGYLLPVAEDAIADAVDIVPFALEGVREDGILYGIPALLCADFLIYDESDPVLSTCSSIDDLLACDGLIAADESNILYYYHGMLIDRQGDAEYIADPDLAENFDENAKERLDSFLSTCEPELTKEGSNAAAAAFSEGRIKGYIGFSESMAGIADVSGTGIRQISFFGEDNTEVFYCDAVGINGSVKPGSRNPVISDTPLLLILNDLYLYVVVGLLNIHVSSRLKNEAQYRLFISQEVFSLEPEKTLRCPSGAAHTRFQN